MVDPVAEWLTKAEEDYRVALSLRRLRVNPAHSSVCFHAQQCIEKYLKAILQKHGDMIRKIHALPVLLDQCSKHYPLLTALRSDLVTLSAYAVEFRYPGESATEEDARKSVDIMKRARRDLRHLL